MLRSGITCEMVLIRPNCQNMSKMCLMTDTRTLGIRPDGWRMTRNDNLHNNRTDSKESKVWKYAFI